MRAVLYTRHARGGRIHVLGLRIHHGAVGVAMVAIGAFLCVHDWTDRWWTHDGD